MIAKPDMIAIRLGSLSRLDDQKANSLFSRVNSLFPGTPLVLYTAGHTASGIKEIVEKFPQLNGVVECTSSDKIDSENWNRQPGLPEHGRLVIVDHQPEKGTSLAGSALTRRFGCQKVVSAINIDFADPKSITDGIEKALA